MTWLRYPGSPPGALPLLTCGYVRGRWGFRTLDLCRVKAVSSESLRLTMNNTNAIRAGQGQFLAILALRVAHADVSENEQGSSGWSSGPSDLTRFRRVFFGLVTVATARLGASQKSKQSYGRGRFRAYAGLSEDSSSIILSRMNTDPTEQRDEEAARSRWRRRRQASRHELPIEAHTLHEAREAWDRGDHRPLMDLAIRHSLPVLNALEPHLGCVLCKGQLIDGRCSTCQGTVDYIYDESISGDD